MGGRIDVWMDSVSFRYSVCGKVSFTDGWMDGWIDSVGFETGRQVGWMDGWISVSLC